MGLSIVKDVSKSFNDNGLYTEDMSVWDYVTLQVVTPSGTINFLSSNDSGAVLGSTDGNALTAQNFLPIQATNLATGTSVSNTGAAGLFKFSAFGRYIRLAGPFATKIFLFCYKIS